MPLLIAAAALSVSLVLERTSMDLLDSLPIAVTVENAGTSPRTERFAQPSEYRLDVVAADGTVVWSSLTPAPASTPSYPVHVRVFPPGTTTLTVYDWNQLTGSGASPLAGSYDLRIRLLAQNAQPESSVRVRFVPPVSPASLGALKSGEMYTLVGTLDATRQTLADERGSAHLSRRLMGAPLDSRVVVRGSVTVAADGTRTFNVLRWARLGP